MKQKERQIAGCPAVGIMALFLVECAGLGDWDAACTRQWFAADRHDRAVD